MPLRIRSWLPSLLMPDSTTGQETIPLPEDPPARVARRIPALTILSHPIMARAGERAVLEGGPLELSRATPDFRRRGSGVRRPLEDPYLTRRPLKLVARSDGGVQLSLEQHNTPVTVSGRPVTGTEELSPEQVARGVPIVLCKRIVLLLHLVEDGTQWPESDLGMMGDSDAIHRVRDQIRKVVDLPNHVLILGETGTGKELVARALHRESKRGGTFVAHNLGAIPETLATAELFGAKRGAFSELKVDRKGLFREAHGGTLFLDEVGDALPQVQVTLLRAVETGEVTPLGTEEAVKVSVRLISATDSDIEARSETGEFRAQLLFRLGYPITVPPLRERPEDIGLLFAHFARQELESSGEPHRLETPAEGAVPWLPTPLVELLVGYRWPGNVRELRDVVQRLVINNRGRATLTADEWLLAKLKSRQGPAPEPGGEERAEYSCDELRSALATCQFEITATAERLGMKRSTLQTWLKRCGIRTAVDLKPEEIARAHHELGGDLDKMSKHLGVSKFALRSTVKTLGLEPGA
jgi:two-component system, NtrC family, nitrogen regulation response regulator GlnG